MTAWKLDQALLDQMACEMMCEAETEAETAEKALMLAQMLANTIAAMRRKGATPTQIAALLRYFAAAGDSEH